ncbi:MAG: major capsid family protein [bacterium]
MSLILTRQLEYVQRARQQRYRPAKFRRLLPVSSEAPAYADTIVHAEVRAYGEDPAKIATHGPIKNLPRPTLTRVESRFSLHRFGYTYAYSIFDLARAEQTGENLTASYATAIQTTVETFLDAIAAGEHLADLGMPGLLNVSTISPLTAGTKAGGGTTWVNPTTGVLNATFDEIVQDVSRCVIAVNTQTLENMTANLVILPLQHYQALIRVHEAFGQISVLERLQKLFPGVRFEAWNRLALADAAGTGPRMVVMATGEDVAKMVIPQELTEEQPVQVPLETVIPMWFGTGGVMVETPDAMVYMDGI